MKPDLLPAFYSNYLLMRGFFFIKGGEMRSHLPLPFLLCLLLAGEALAQTVYLQPDEALKINFPGAVIVSEQKNLLPDAKLKVEKQFGKKLKKDKWTFQVARSGGKIAGYALLDIEIGKTEPITFMTFLTPEGRVKSVEILVYREAYGSEVHQKPFLDQYRGKKSSDTLKLGKEITNVTGATLSARAVTVGVRRGLLLWEEFYGKK